MSWTGAKPTRNTDLLKTMRCNTPLDREYQERWYEEDASLRTHHISLIMKECSPFRTRGWGGGGGWAHYRMTVDARSYTVLTLADDPAEWKRWGPLGFRSLMQPRLRDIEYHHLMRQAEKDRAAWLADH